MVKKIGRLPPKSVDLTGMLYVPHFWGNSDDFLRYLHYVGSSRCFVVMMADLLLEHNRKFFVF